MLFYAKDSGAKTLEEITSLDLSGKNLLFADDISFLKKMTNLKHLDISDNIDMYKPSLMLENEAKKAAEGSGADHFDFLDNKHDRDVFLEHFSSVEHLVCDIILEVYIMEMRPKKNYLPNLITINKVALTVTDLTERTNEKKILEQLSKIWMFTGQYRLAKPGVMDSDPTFFITDEVGCAISHGDKPNL